MKLENVLNMSIEPLYPWLQYNIWKDGQHVICASLVPSFIGIKQGKSAINQLETRKNAIFLSIRGQRPLYLLQFSPG